VPRGSAERSLSFLVSIAFFGLAPTIPLLAIALWHVSWFDGHGDEQMGADSDDRAHAFQSDAAHRSDLIARM